MPQESAAVSLEWEEVVETRKVLEEKSKITREGWYITDNDGEIEVSPLLSTIQRLKAYGETLALR